MIGAIIDLGTDCYRLSHTVALKPQASHAAHYLTTLASRDNADGEDFDAADHVVSVSEYNFGGFYQPVAAAPAISGVQLGRNLHERST